MKQRSLTVRLTLFAAAVLHIACATTPEPPPSPDQQVAAKRVALEFLDSIAHNRAAQARGRLTGDVDDEFLIGMISTLADLHAYSQAAFGAYPDSAAKIRRGDPIYVWAEAIRAAPPTPAEQGLVALHTYDPNLDLYLRREPGGWKVDFASPFHEDISLKLLLQLRAGDIARQLAREIQHGAYKSFDEVESAFSRRVRPPTTRP